ncbi:peptide/nickel transport system substrate-binding protein [Kribbella sp. VKM Ac-2527]|uniref:Peptide/nickel transport system substrate-binding protein n=1 Tax=Kribbella caucasensis TaxID=2512215 RepID=A0A4R6KKM1_9ACTN|nr:ABC transporter substrate-binding protein [Kribbella sp. VKM Ac-2527]TDO51276.1 peptide/nickel transport system substrate-binding protein [Kribbella sp. VKM Ac-2527]
MKRHLINRAVALCCAVSLAACSSSTAEDKPGAPEGYNAALQGVVNPSQQQGGTLKVGTSASCDNFDPGTTYGGSCWFLHRLLSRNLVSFGKTGQGAAAGNGAKLQADLAESLGQANADKTVWTYKLRDGLKFSTGAPITSADVKYAFERMYATDVITGGPQGYYLCLLDKCAPDGTPTYQGPYKDAKGSLSSITTPDAKTVVFKLTKPFGDWDYLMALPAAAPVPKKNDKGSQYGAGTNLVSSGPYILKTVKPKQSVLLARNPSWDRTSDPIRSALPDSIDITVLSNADDLDARIKTGALNVSLDGGVQTTFQSQILSDPKLKANADNPVLRSTTMLILYPSDPTLANLHCRRAIAYAVDKRDLVIQYGGTNGADFATTLMPRGLAGHDDKSNLYPSGADWTGDLEKAKSELAECGKPDGFSTSMGFSNYGNDPQVFASVQSALKRVGITLTPKQLDASTSYNTLSTPAAVKGQRIGIGLMGWIPDYPSGNGFLTLLVDPARYTGSTSSTNFVGVDEPAINVQIEKAATASSDELAGVYQEMDKATMETAYYIPVTYAKATLYRGAALTNVDMTGDLGTYDLANIGVKAP